LCRAENAKDWVHAGDRHRAVVFIWQFYIIGYGEPNVPQWKRVARVAYIIVFFLVWLDGVAAFLYFGRVFRGGSPVPTSTQIEPLRNHSQVVYIAHSQSVLVHLLLTVMGIGIPSVMVAAFILHYLLGVKLFANVPASDS
jgi:hypothetical protein